MRDERRPTELKRDGFSVGLKLLENFPYEFCAWQTLLKDSTSRLFVDDADSPKVALLCSPDGKGIGLVAGDASLALHLFEFVLEGLANPPRLQFVSLPSDNWRRPNEVYPEGQFFEHQRVSFTLEDTGKVEGWQGRIPDGFSVQAIDQSLAEQIQGGWSQWFPKIERFAAQGAGFCVLHDAHVVSLAYGLLVSGCMEIIVETDKEFQCQGLASICCAALIQHCLQHAITPLWSASASHGQSTSLAKKLGFGNETLQWWLVRRQ